LSELILKNVGKTYPNGVEAVQDVSLHIADHEFVVFVGPSGCGKSTLLQLIAGLEEVTAGEIWIDGRMVNEVEPKDRDVAMVFQNYALYPYMTVYDNMAFGLKMRKVKKAVIKQKVEQTAEILGLSGLLQRKPKELSGGQRQRVAMGRAMVRNPKVFLMDEPLSNLDAKLRGNLRREIARLHQTLDATFIYVTHDQTEAMTLGTRIAVINNGTIQQIDTPQMLHDCPANKFVAGFIGTPSMNFFSGRCIMQDRQIRLEIAGTSFWLPSGKEAKIAEGDYIDKEIIVGIRPEDISDTQETAARYPEDILTCAVSNYEMTGSEVYLYFNVSDTEVCARADAQTVSRTGSTVRFTFCPERIHLFDPLTGTTITN